MKTENFKRITDLLKEKEFTISVELVPPRNGTSPDEILKVMKSIRKKVDFISITKGAGGSLRGGSLPFSYIAMKNYGINTISHFVCRERTKYELENELMDLHYLGLKNILALRGDAPVGNKDETWNGDYCYAYHLVEQIKNLNKGSYLPRTGIDTEARKGEATDFCILVAGHPEDPIEEEIKHLKCKIEAGAEVIITQMIFTFEDYKRYVEALRAAGIDLPVIPGIRPLVTLQQAESVEKFFRLAVPEEVKKILRESKNEKQAFKRGISYTLRLMEKLKQFGAPGVHLFVLNDLKVVKHLVRKRRERKVDQNRAGVR
jgi:methylenetetrahydrofolate reductase (NADPH)